MKLYRQQYLRRIIEKFGGYVHWGMVGRQLLEVVHQADPLGALIAAIRQKKSL